MLDEAAPVTQRLAATVRALRAERALSLDALAAASGVSRSTLSLIERGEASPTAVVLDKIATGLGISLASLFRNDGDATEHSPLVRRADQTVWRDPSSGYVRRAISPPPSVSPIQVAEVTFPPDGRISFETAGRRPVIHQQIWVQEGAIHFTIGTEEYRLEKGDCLAVVLDRPTMFHNPTAEDARYVVAVVAEPVSWR